MKRLRVEKHEHLGTPSDPSPAAIDAARVWEAAETAILGHADFSYGAGEIAAYAAEDADEAMVLFLVRDGDRCVGFLHADLPLRDNVHLAHVELRAMPDVDAVAVLDAAWPEFAAFCREKGRTAITFWELSGTDGATIRAVNGDGAVAPTPVTEWLAARGFFLDQVEVASTATVDSAPVGVPDAATDTAPDAGIADGYRVRTWEGPTPPDLVDGLVRLRARMYVDAPHGSRTQEEGNWDADRVRRVDAQIAEAGRTALWAVALDESDEPVAYTCLECPGFRPDVAFQQDTFVRRDDRGHGLGMAVKAANLRQLRRVRPQVARVHTWNAGENEWMLAINRELGYVPTCVVGAWELGTAGMGATEVGTAETATAETGAAGE